MFCELLLLLPPPCSKKEKYLFFVFGEKVGVHDFFSVYCYLQECLRPTISVCSRIVLRGWFAWIGLHFGGSYHFLMSIYWGTGESSLQTTTKQTPTHRGMVFKPKNKSPLGCGVVEGHDPAENQLSSDFFPISCRGLCQQTLCVCMCVVFLAPFFY